MLAGHPWVYDNEIQRVVGLSGPATLEPGEIADVEGDRKVYLGRAFVNPRSKIVARIYSPSKEGVDKGFFKHRIRDALLRRRPFYDLRRDSARIVFAEADLLPGLVVDRFVGWPLSSAEASVKDSGGRPRSFEELRGVLGEPGSWLSVQFLAYGMDLRKDEILAALNEVLDTPLPAAGSGAASGTASGAASVAASSAASGTASQFELALGIPLGVVERDDAPVRELEGLPLFSGLASGSYPEEGILIYEQGLPFAVDLLGGQKTGYYLDQRNNRCLAAGFAPGKRVLDMCCHGGGFAVHAARAGAASVVAVDSSLRALESVRANVALNGLDGRVETVQGDLFEVLRAYEAKKERFGLIVLDPPAFAKSRSALEGAMKGYKEINLRALNLLDAGGILVTCSCSHSVDENRFKAMVAAAALDSGRRIRQLHFGYQSADHPILIGYDESLYLKCGVYQVAD